VAFAVVGDGSTVEPLQAVLKPEQAAEYVQTISQFGRVLTKIQAYHMELL
jgi:hypothetical protein